MVKTSGPRPVKATITTPARALNTTYQNATGRPLFCIVACTAFRANVLAAQARAIAYVDTVTPPVDLVADAGFAAQDNNPESGTVTLVFAVPPGYYYRIVSTTAGAGSAVGLIEWTEVEL